MPNLKAVKDISAPPVYLDANATEPLRPAAYERVSAGLALYGNPASVHAYGRQARRFLEEARAVIAASFGREPGCCVFTSGGTEADALAVHAFGRGRTLFIGATEHDAIRRAAPGAHILRVTAQGLLDLEDLRARLAASGPALVCVMAANNETGVLSPLEEVSEICRSFGARLHVDAVQSAGRLALPLAALKDVSFAISGHKMGGPKGAGALLLAADEPLDALMPGGGQERGRRGGTPPLPALLGMAAALQESRDQDWGRIDALRRQVERSACAAGARVAGQGAPRLPNTSCLVLDGVPAQTQLMRLDLAGFCVSAGSACSSGKVSPSHVLQAMGEEAGASQAIRVSLPWNICDEDVTKFCAAYDAMAGALRRPS